MKKSEKLAEKSKLLILPSVHYLGLNCLNNDMFTQQRAQFTAHSVGSLNLQEDVCRVSLRSALFLSSIEPLATLCDGGLIAIKLVELCAELRSFLSSSHCRKVC